ncbi:efflux transporter outer membrane subunit [Providencia rettgeri]|nr:efflux transporter outer membrane subunit [Providencia rettgeri]ELR5233729.1 efflux transporter outer membrane subunit [Providencia rettgeri]
MKIKSPYFGSVVLFICLLSGCGSFTRTEYQRPDLILPQQWDDKIQRSSSANDVMSSDQQRNTVGRWWENFNDPKLSQLINQVLENSNDLALAAIKLKQARNTAGLANTNITPDFSLGGSASNTKSIRHGNSSQESYSADLTLSYEIDLWGKLARVREKNTWEAVATEQDYHATTLVIINTTAQLYWNIALLNQQIKNLTVSQEIAQKSQQLIQSWYLAGKVSQLDLLQSEQTIISRKNELRRLIKERESSRNALALLLNRPAELHASELAFLNSEHRVEIQEMTPLAVLAQRPDIQAAESRLRSALAGSDAAKLSFYPTLSLQGALNAGSQLFTQWFSDPTRVIGSNISLPFIQWNTVKLTIEQSDLQVQQAAVSFRSTAYSALAEIDNAMEARFTADEIRTQLQQSLSLSQQRLKLTGNRYRAGAVDYQTLLNAQDDLLSIENSLAQNQYDYLYATLQLWLAQGGGSVHHEDNQS